MQLSPPEAAEDRTRAKDTYTYEHLVLTYYWIILYLIKKPYESQNSYLENIYPIGTDIK